MLARLDSEDKYWKFNPADIDERGHWADYRTAYEIALERTNTEVAPWYVVPADKKWYRNLVVGQLLLDALRGMELQLAARGLRRRGAATPADRRGAAGVIETVAVTRYVTPLREGGSLPGLVEGDDLGTYVCKFRGAGQGVRVLVAEVIVSGLAMRLGLQTPRLVALDLDPEIARYEADEEVQDLLNASPGLNLGDRLPARGVRVRRARRRRPSTTAPECSGSTPSPRTSTAPGATPTCCSGTATSG